MAKKQFKEIDLDGLVDRILSEQFQAINGEHILLYLGVHNYRDSCQSMEKRGDHKGVFLLTTAVMEAADAIAKERESSSGSMGKPSNFTGDGYLFSFPPNADIAAIQTAVDLVHIGRAISDIGFLGSNEVYMKAGLYKGP